MFDIRTVLILTVVYNFLLSTAIFLYNRTKKYPHNARFSLGMLLIGSGFLLLSLRDFIDQFASTIISNTLIILGIMLLSKGIAIYTHMKKNPLSSIMDSVIITCFIMSFLYFTYVSPNINMRIIIISMVQILYFIEIIRALFKQKNPIITKESRLVSLMFILATVIQSLRIFFTFYEPPMTSFMTAGLIHSVSVIIYQLMPFNLALGIFLMDNAIIKNQLETQAMTDGLTELYNRVAFVKIVTSQCKRTQRHQDTLAIVMCDIDFFKRVNDTYGHQAGDLILQQIPKIFHEHVRGSDVIGRYGGEEFILALMDINLSDLAQLLEKVRSNIEESIFSYEGKPIKVTMSFGATLIQDDFDLDAAIRRADTALYQSKHSGRNCINFQ